MNEFPDGTTESPSEAETEIFCPETNLSSADEKITAFEKEYFCAICILLAALAESFLESGGSFHVVGNIDWLRYRTRLCMQWL